MSLTLKNRNHNSELLLSCTMHQTSRAIFRPLLWASQNSCCHQLKWCEPISSMQESCHGEFLRCLQKQFDSTMIKYIILINNPCELQDFTNPPESWMVCFGMIAYETSVGWWPELLYITHAHAFHLLQILLIVVYGWNPAPPGICKAYNSIG